MSRIFFLFFLPAFCLGTEFQYWQIAYFNQKITDKWSFVFQTEERWKGVYSNLVRHQNDIGIAYTFNDHWNIHVYYRHKVRNSDHGWATYPEQLIDFSGKWNVGEININNRHRFVIHYYGNHWVYRNRITLAYPIIPYCQKGDLYFSNEFFFKNLQKFFENRFGAGIQLSLSKTGNKVRCVYLMQHTNRATGWTHTLNILLIESKIYF